MELKDAGNNGLMDRTTRLLTYTLGYRSKNHGVISANLANVDTPDFRPKELLFDEELRRAAEKDTVQLKKTHEKHFTGPGNALSGDHGFTLQEQKGPKGSPAELDIDREMARLAENNLVYEAAVRMLSKKFEALRTAIEERRR